MPDDFSAEIQQREAEFQKGFAALNAQTDKAQAERQRVLKPARQEVEKAMDEPKPGIPGEAGGPEIPKTPEPPKSNFQQDAVQWMAISAVISGIAGALTRRHATNALNAFAGAINGFRQGKMDVYEQQYKTWQEENQKVQEETRNLWQRRDALLKDRKMNIDEKMARLQLLDSETGDQVNYQVAQQKNFTLYTHNQDMLDLKLQQMQATSDRINEKYTEFRTNFIAKTGHTPEQFQALQSDLLDRLHKTAPPGETKEQFEARYQQAWQTMRAAGEEGGTPADREASAAQVATGMPLAQAIPGWGKSATAERKQAKSDALKLIQAQNPDMSPADAGVELARRTIEFQAGKTSVGQLTTMLGATRQAVNQLEFNIRKVEETMKRLPSSDLSPVINAIARGEEKWTGDPAYSSLFFFMNGVATESARLLAGGQASRAQLHVGAMEEAQKWANINMTPASFHDVGQSMLEEGANRVENFQMAIKAQEGFGGSSPAPRPGGAVPPKTAPGGGGDGWTIQQVQ